MFASSHQTADHHASREPSGKRRFRGFLAGTAFSGAVIFAATGIYFSDAGKVWAADCVPSSGQGTTSLTYNSVGVCTLPVTSEFNYTGQDYTVSISGASDIETRGGNLYVGSPGSAGGASGSGNMMLTITGPAEFTMGPGAVAYIGYKSASISNTGSGYLHVTGGGRAGFNDLFLLSGTQSASNGSIRVDGGSTLTADNLVISNGNSAVFDGNGTSVSVTKFTIGNTDAFDSVPSSGTNSITVTNGAELMFTESGTVADGQIVFQNGGTYIYQHEGLSFFNVGTSTTTAKMILGDPDNLGNPLYAAGNKSLRVYGENLVNVSNGSEIIFNHTATQSDPYIANFAARGLDGSTGFHIRNYAGWTNYAGSNAIVLDHALGHVDKLRTQSRAETM